jgi:hypothetical protein
VRDCGCALLALLLSSVPASAQDSGSCRVLCAPEFHVEPTVTLPNVFGAPRIQQEDGGLTRAPRTTDFEVILSLGLPTRLSRLEFTVEAIFLPFERDSTPELEFETNFIWLTGERSGGWISSHFDIVDKYSAAERPTDRRAYTHKLNLELDTSVSVFRWVPDGRWLRRVELESSLDYVVTGLARAGDRINGGRYVDDASPWSLSIVFVLPIAPL